jgi:hypothetical protein
MIRPNYWLTRQQQRRAYRNQLMQQYATALAIIAFVVLLCMF